MSDLENNIKLITHIAFKELNSFDIYGNIQSADKPFIVPNSTNHNLESKIIEIRYNNENEIGKTNYNSKIVNMPKLKTVEDTSVGPYKHNDIPVKRIVSGTNAWKSIDVTNFSVSNQFKFIEDESNITDIVSSELKKKISSYKSQDKRKKLYNNDEFIDIKFILKLLNDTNLKCYYCDCNVFILYDIVRELKQWTVERIDNRLGHNKNNSVISCLECNLRRRTMYHENYLLTKQLKLTKVGI